AWRLRSTRGGRRRRLVSAWRPAGPGLTAATWLCIIQPTWRTETPFRTTEHDGPTRVISRSLETYIPMCGYVAPPRSASRSAAERGRRQHDHRCDRSAPGFQPGFRPATRPAHRRRGRTRARGVVLLLA